MMRKKFCVAFSVAAGLLMAAGTMFAHHSENNYDHDRLIRLRGTVAKFEFVNPHCVLHIDIKNPQGETEEWIGVSGSPNEMRRHGWTNATFKPGDKVDITAFVNSEGRKIVQMPKIAVNGENIPSSTIAGVQLEGYYKRNPGKPPESVGE
jgi:hypothetical protein